MDGGSQCFRDFGSMCRLRRKISTRAEQAVIEEALGEDAASVLPEAIRLLELRARVPRYQREMLRELARMEGASVDHVLTRRLRMWRPRVPRSWRGRRDSRWRCSGRQVRPRNETERLSPC